MEKPSREKSPPKLKPKLAIQPPRNISPIPEGSKSTDSSLLRQSSVVSDPDVHCEGFHPGFMIAVFSVHWLTSSAIATVGLVLTFNSPSKDHACHLYFVMVYLRIAFWIGTYAQHELIKPALQKLVNQNYNLYRDMACYRKAPLQIVSFWNTMLIAVQSYVRSLFNVHEHGANICAGISGVIGNGLDISPQLFIVIFCCLETVALGCFYVPAIKRLVLSMQPQEEDSPNRTLSNQDDIPINQRLKRQSEQVKILWVANRRLKKEAYMLGALDEN